MSAQLRTRVLQNSRSEYRRTNDRRHRPTGFQRFGSDKKDLIVYLELAQLSSVMLKVERLNWEIWFYFTNSSLPKKITARRRAAQIRYAYVVSKRRKLQKLCRRKIIRFLMQNQASCIAGLPGSVQLRWPAWANCILPYCRNLRLNLHRAECPPNVSLKHTQEKTAWTLPWSFEISAITASLSPTVPRTTAP